VLRVISRDVRDAAALALDASDNLYVTSVHANGEGYVTIYAANTSKVCDNLTWGDFPPSPAHLGSDRKGDAESSFRAFYSGFDGYVAGLHLNGGAERPAALANSRPAASLGH